MVGQGATLPSYQESLQPGSQLPQSEKGRKFLLRPGSRAGISCCQPLRSCCASQRGHRPGSARTQGVCSEEGLLFAASGLCSLDANVTGLPGTDINPDTHKLL